jgi:hypothetical protein
MRRITQENAEPQLPEWDDWGKLFVDGLKLTAAGLIYALPVILLFMLGYAFYFLPALLSMVPDSEDFIGPLFLIGMGSGWCLFGISMLLSLFLLFIVPAALAHLVSEDSFAAAFHFSSWWAIFRAGFGNFFVASLIMLGLLGILYMVYVALFFTLVLCWLAPFILIGMAAYIALVYFALVAQAYRSGRDQLSPPSSLVETVA